MIKVTKALAKKLYEEGKEIMILPDRTKPTSKMAVWLTKPEKTVPDAFNKLCEVYFHYNCSPEAGMKLNFYAKEEEI